MSRPNRYEGDCRTCRTLVPAETGYAIPPEGACGWTVSCKACSGVREDARPTIQVRLHEAGVSFKPAGFLGGELFTTYRAACDGARYSGGAGNVAPMSIAASILQKLVVAAAFVIDVSPEVGASFQAYNANLTSTILITDERSAKVDAELRGRGLALFPFQRGGITWLASREAACLADDMGLGKAQPMSEPILTPDGWVPIGTLKIGDRVIGSDGLPVKVTGIFPQGEKEVYRVTMTDGASARSCEEHLWCVQSPLDRFRGGKRRVLALKEIVSRGLRDGAGNRKWFIPIVDAVEFSERVFSVHPYLLGALIANGHLDHTTSHSGKDEQREEMLPYIPDGLTYSRADSVTSRISSGAAGKANQLTRILGRLELKHTRSHSKFIPELYLSGSVEQRVDLLCGLMDNDGTISLDGYSIEYNTVSDQLAKDVIELIRSLGGSAWVSKRRPKFTYKGKKKIGRTDHRIRMAVPFCPFRVSWKKDRYMPRSKYPPAHAIDSVVLVGVERCVCISVDAEDHMYVTADYLLTHNTLQAGLALPAGAGAVVVAPAVAKGVWKREMAKWRPEITVTVLSGRGSFRAPVAGEMVVTNYELLPDEAPALPPGCVVVADEAHLLKSRKAARSKRFCKLSAAARAAGGKVWLLTATPILNRPTEMWNLFEAAGIAHEAFGGYRAFTRLFDGVQGGWGGWSWGTPESEEIARRLSRVMLRRAKSEVLADLPAKRWSSITVDIDAGTRALCDEVDVEAVVAAIKAGEKLDFKKMSAARAALAKAKIAAMLEVVESHEEQGEPLVVFSAHRAPIDALAKRDGWAVITGDTLPEKRTAIEQAFQAGELRGVGCTIKAGGVAITLTKAANALFVDKEWTPALNGQAEDRIYRIGQTRGVLITSLIADHPLDARVDELVAEKTRIIDASVEAARTLMAPAIEIVKVDFDAIATAAAEEAAANAVVRAEAKVRAKAFEGMVVVASCPGRRRPRAHQVEELEGRRAAGTAQEMWASDALGTLAALDPDHASKPNDMGFNGTDTRRGHGLAIEVRSVGLTDRQWVAAIKLCQKYHRQMGKCPDAPEANHAATVAA
jgi:hypothetical protein